MPSLSEQFLTQLDEILGEFRDLAAQAQYEDMSNLPEERLVRFLTRAKACIRRVAGDPSPYMEQCDESLQEKVFLGFKARYLAGIVDSLREDVAAGYLRSHAELIHGELFADFLEMGEHLLNEGYKDPAAVIAGSSLEAHLRQLCAKTGIATETTTPAGVTPHKADRLNADLVKAGTYTKLDQKNVTAWLDLRNKAAHGHYGEYEGAQVSLLIAGVRDFMTRVPA